MARQSQLIVKENRLNQVKQKMLTGGQLTEQQTLREIADAIRQAAPYQGQVEVTVEDGVININPWWIGFIEIGTVQRAARPFAGPAATRVLEEFVPKLKAIGASL